MDGAGARQDALEQSSRPPDGGQEHTYRFQVPTIDGNGVMVLVSPTPKLSAYAYETVAWLLACGYGSYRLSSYPDGSYQVEAPGVNPMRWERER